LSSDVPEEVEPLVGEVNSLLEAQEAALKRAHDRAGDLAHGLKTPLTALASDVRRLRQAGEGAIADDIQLSAQIMHRHIERELARTRLRNQHGQLPASRLAPAASAIVKTVARTPEGEHIDFEVKVAADATIAFDPDDLNDVLGNLVENAARYARGAVRISAMPNGGGDLVMRVEDDGPGVEPGDIDKLFERGRRLDEKGGSAGLGLAIVQDILTEYGTALKAETSDLGGLALSFEARAVAG
jgi:signal transduction histidine kinase